MVIIDDDNGDDDEDGDGYDDDPYLVHISCSYTVQKCR